MPPAALSNWGPRCSGRRGPGRREGRGVGLGSCYGQEATDQNQLGLCPQTGHYALFHRVRHFSLESRLLPSDWHAEILSENQVFVIKGDPGRGVVTP